MACRVVCGRLLTMPTFSPTRALVNVVLPALGRPTRQAKPLRYGGWSGGVTPSILPPGDDTPAPPVPCEPPPLLPGGSTHRSRGRRLPPALQGHDMPEQARRPRRVGRQTVVRSAPSGPARCTGADGVRSWTAASPASSTPSAAATTAAASSPSTPLETAAATAACSADSCSDGSETVAAR